MLTPVEFLLARVTDLEQVARDLYGEHGTWECMTPPKFNRPTDKGAVAYGKGDEFILPDPLMAWHIATWDPAFVLAWCAAVRQVSDLHASCIFCVKQQGGTMLLEDIDELWGGEPCRTLLALLQPFADHPDFDPAWRQEEA